MAGKENTGTVSVPERYWRITVERYYDWTSNEGEAKTARTNGYEVVGPYVLTLEVTDDQ